MPGPLSKSNIKPPSKPKPPEPVVVRNTTGTTLTNKPGPEPTPPKEKKVKPQRRLLKMFTFTEDRYYPTNALQWRRADGTQPPGTPVVPNAATILGMPFALDGVILCQLYYHESVTIARGEPDVPVSPELMRWVPVSVEGATP